jgi:hypothetical protein
MTTAKYLATMAQSALRNPNGFQSFLRVIAAYGLIQGMTSDLNIPWTVSAFLRPSLTFYISPSCHLIFSEFAVLGTASTLHDAMPLRLLPMRDANETHVPVGFSARPHPRGELARVLLHSAYRRPACFANWWLLITHTTGALVAITVFDPVLVGVVADGELHVGLALLCHLLRGELPIVAARDRVSSLFWFFLIFSAGEVHRPEGTPCSRFCDLRVAVILFIEVSCISWCTCEQPQTDFVRNAGGWLQPRLDDEMAWALARGNTFLQVSNVRGLGVYYAE